MKWEDPPSLPRVDPPGVHSNIAAELKNRPGNWALVGTYAAASVSSSMAYQIRTGRLPTYLPTGSFEAKARTVGREHRVYARYVGEGAQ